MEIKTLHDMTGRFWFDTREVVRTEFRVQVNSVVGDGLQQKVIQLQQNIFIGFRASCLQGGQVGNIVRIHNGVVGGEMCGCDCDCVFSNACGLLWFRIRGPIKLTVQS